MPRRPFGQKYGEPYSLNIANPGAGAQATVTLPAGSLYWICSLGFALVCDANVATRVAGIQWNETTQFLAIYPRQIIAGTNWFFSFNRGGAHGTGTISGAITNYGYGNMPTNLIVNGGTVFGTQIQNLQAGDLITSINLLALRYVA